MEEHESEDVKWFLDFLKSDSSDFLSSYKGVPLNKALSLVGTVVTSVLFSQITQTLTKKAKKCDQPRRRENATVSLNVKDVTYQRKVEMKYICRRS